MLAFNILRLSCEVSTGGSRSRAWPGGTARCPGPTSRWRSAGRRRRCARAPPPGCARSSRPGSGPRPQTRSAVWGPAPGPGTARWCIRCQYLKEVPMQCQQSVMLYLHAHWNECFPLYNFPWFIKKSRVQIVVDFYRSTKKLSWGLKIPQKFLHFY